MAYTIQCVSSVADIGRETWDALWPAETEGYDFYRCQEEAGIENFKFFYLAIYDGKHPVLIAPLFTAPFNMGLAMNDAWRARLEKVQKYWPRFLVFKGLFCGAPTSERNIVGIAEPYRRDPELFAALDRALLDLARQHRVFMITFKDLIDADAQKFLPMKKLGWFTGDSMPTTVLDTSYTSMEDYFAKLGPKTRKEMRRKLRHSMPLIEVETTTNISNLIDDIYRLYRNVHDRGIMSFEILTPTYFLNFCRYMPDNTLYFLYWLKDEVANKRRLIGMDFCLHFGDRFLAKFTGMDYTVSRDLNLYFIGIQSNIEWCIEHRMKSCILGGGCYEAKQHLGARLIPLRTLTKIVNPVMNFFPSLFSSNDHDRALTRYLKTEIVVQRPVADVWAALTNFDAYKQWNPFILSASGEARAGTMLAITMRLPGKPEQPYRVRIMEATPAQELTWPGHFKVKGLCDGMHRFRLEEVKPGVTHVIHEETFSGLLVPLIWWDFERRFREAFTSLNESLKQFVEQAPR